MNTRSLEKTLLLVIVSLLALLQSQQAAAQSERVIVFPLETVNAEPELARAASLTLAAELEERGFTVGDVLAVEELLEERRDTGATIGPTPDGQPARSLDDLYRELSGELGAGSYFTGRLVGLGGQLRIEATHYDSSGELLAMQRAVAASEAALPETINRLVTSLVMIPPPGTPPPPAPAPAPAAAPAPAPAASGSLAAAPPPAYLPLGYNSEAAPPPGRPTRSASGFEKSLGVALVQTFGISKELPHTTGINFDGRFEWTDFLLVVNAGVNFGDVEIPEGLHLNLDLTFAGYLSKKQISPYLGAGFGLYLLNRLDNSKVCSDPNDPFDDHDNDSNCDPKIGWNIFPTVGLEFLRERSMRLHVELRYVFVLNAGFNWGHGPVIAVGVGF